MHIMIAEDDEDDVILIEEAFHANHFKGKLSFVKDGQEALDYLKDNESVCGNSPQLIILDLNMPKVNGLGVLKEIRFGKHRQLPVIIYSTSNDPRNIEACYNLGANTYIVKPETFDKVQTLVKALMDYWFNQAVKVKAAG